MCKFSVNAWWAGMLKGVCVDNGKRVLLWKRSLLQNQIYISLNCFRKCLYFLLKNNYMKFDSKLQNKCSQQKQLQ